MNPAIHHPSWYQALGMLAQLEVEDSLRKGPVVGLQLARFAFDAVEVLCLPDRWQIRGPVQESPRLVELAVRVFDRLDDTPVSAIGVNNDMHIQTEHADVAQRLVGTTLVSDLGLDALGMPVSARHVLGYAVGEVTFKLTVDVSPLKPGTIVVGHNAHRNAPTAAPHFALGPLITQLSEEAGAHSERCAAALEARFQ